MQICLNVKSDEEFSKLKDYTMISFVIFIQNKKIEVSQNSYKK